MLKKSLFCFINTTIKQALKQINVSGEKCLIVIDTEKKLLGTLSDGDLRRAILKGIDFKKEIKNIYNKKPISLLSKTFDNRDVRKIFLETKIDIIPVVNDNNEVVDILSWDKLFKSNKGENKSLVEIPVVIMAGGRGERLEPFTRILPKPLVPIHEKPIIEHIIERFTNIGVKNFYLTVNYKSKIIKAYFDELNADYNIHFVDEKTPMGTAGSLSLLEGKFNNPFFVTNCDIIIKADYANILDFHEKSGNDISLVASAKEYIIPYGTCEVNNEGYLSRINEKPKYDFLINTGLYIINPNILKHVPKNKFYHITHLIEDVKNQGKKVGIFPIDDESWIDIGQWVEYKKVVDAL